MGKKLDLPKAEFHKTSIRGVKYLETTRRGKKERVYYIRYRTPAGKQRFEPAGPTATTEAKANAIRLDRARGKELPNRERRAAQEAAKVAAASRWTFDKLWEAWQTEDENKGKRGTFKADQKYRLHIQPRFGNREPKALVPLDIDRLRLELAEGHSKETTKSILGLIRRIERYGAATGKCPPLSFPIVLKGKKLGRDPEEKRTPTEAEVAAYIRTCAEWEEWMAGAFLLFIVFTGARRGSARNLKWQDVDLDNFTAIMKDSKTGDVQIVLNDDAYTLLKIMQTHWPTDGFVFTGAAEDGGRTQRQIDRIPRKIADAAGWPKDLDPCHSFRRRLATLLDVAGYSTATIMAAGGWKSAAMPLHYTAVKKEHVRKAMNALGGGRT